MIGSRVASLRAHLRRSLLPARRLRTDERGVAAIEFAIIAPFFFCLLFVIAETAVILIAEQVMDNAVFETARLIRTGQVQRAGTSSADFKASLCARMAVFISCDSPNFYLDVRSFESFADIESGKPVDENDNFAAEGAYDFGEAKEIVIVRAYYQWPTNPIVGGLSLANMSNGKRLIGAFSAFRNEPYESTAQAQ